MRGITASARPLPAGQVARRPTAPCSPRRVHVQVLRREAPSGGAPHGLPWSVRPEALIVPSAAAALLLLASPGQLPSQLQLGLTGSSISSLEAPVQQRPRSAAEAHIWAQQAWRQRQQLPVLAAPSMLAALPQQMEAAASQLDSQQGQEKLQQQQQEQDTEAAVAPQQQRSSGADRALQFDQQTAGALAACMVVAALANSAGIGGGAFVVPLMYLGLGFDIKDSTALSQAVIAGGALGSVACVVQQHHPADPSRPLIDYSMALVLTPTLLLGCNTGVLLNKLLPNWAVTFLLIPLLCYLTLRTGKTAARLYKAENEAAAAGQLLPGQEVVWRDTLEGGSLAGVDVSGLATGEAAQQAQQTQQTQQQLQTGCRIPWDKAAELLVLWAALLCFQHAKSHSEGLQFVALYAAQAVAAIGASGFFIWQAVYNRGGSVLGTLGSSWEEDPAPLPVAEAEGQAGALPCSTMDPSDWGPECLAESAAIALGGGAVAGMLGIGGGMIVGPLMLELGMLPQVTQATASAMVLFSSSSAAASFAIEGRLNMPHAAAFGAACALAAFAGVGLVGEAVRRSGRASLVVMLLTAIVGAGCLLTVMFSGTDAVAELLSGPLGCYIRFPHTG